LFVTVPHCTPLHAVTLSGVQQDVPLQTWAPVHPLQLIVWPQLFVAVVLHLPAHGVTLSGAQHVLPWQISLADEQFVVPPAPQATTWPQLLVALPHVLPAHVVERGSGTQPHEPASLQVRPPSQPPQLTGWPQLSVLDPQRFWHHVDGGVGEQHAPELHTPPSAHVVGHCTFCAQLFVTVPPHLLPQAVALSGVQHVSFDRHTSALPAHVDEPLAPQATDCPQLFVAEPQFFPVHVLAAGSGTHPQAPCVHDRPPSHPPQFTGLPQLSKRAPQRLSQKLASGTQPSPPPSPGCASPVVVASASPVAPSLGITGPSTVPSKVFPPSSP
jgi:hypothetical protein